MGHVLRRRVRITDINFLDELFYSLEVWGYLGPLFLVACGYVITKKDKNLGKFFFVFIAVVSVTYFNKFSTDPGYIWHAIFLLFGGVITCIYPQLDS